MADDWKLTDAEKIQSAWAAIEHGSDMVYGRVIVDAAGRKALLWAAQWTMASSYAAINEHATTDQRLHITILRPPQPRWEWTLGGNFTELAFRVPTAPNTFHRLMLRVFLGIHYRRLKE